MVPQPVKAVVMLYPITPATEAAKDEEEAKLRSASHDVPPGVWFTKQTVSNACGTVGLLHAMANTDVKISAGSFLDRFFSTSRCMTPEERARLLENPKQGEPDLESSHQDAAQGGQSEPPSEGEEV